MKIIDISMPIRPGMPVYKNNPQKQPVIEIIQDFGHGSARESRVHLDAHVGTHLDAPLHMVQDGTAIGNLDLYKLIGQCTVFDLSQVIDAIGEAELVNLPIDPGDFVLLKTKNSFEKEFNHRFVYLSEAGANFLVKKQVRGVGIDALGIERDQPAHPTHQILFENGVVILEGLRLEEARPGNYLLVALPIKLMDIEAAPARAVLINTLLPITSYPFSS